MNDVYFTTNDTKAIVNYIKNIVRTKGYNYNITEPDLNYYNIPYDQSCALQKFRLRFQNNYLCGLNNIYGNYVVLKGGATTLTKAQLQASLSGLNPSPQTKTQLLSALTPSQQTRAIAANAAITTLGQILAAKYGTPQPGSFPPQFMPPQSQQAFVQPQPVFTQQAFATPPVFEEPTALTGITMPITSSDCIKPKELATKCVECEKLDKINYGNLTEEQKNKIHECTACFEYNKAKKAQI